MTWARDTWDESIKVPMYCPFVSQYRGYYAKTALIAHGLKDGMH